MTTKTTRTAPRRRKALQRAAANHNGTALRKDVGHEVSSKAARIGRVVAFGSLVFLGMVVVAGAGSLAAALSGIEPRGYEKEARGIRRYAQAHRPKWLRAPDIHDLESRVASGGDWVRDQVRSMAK